MVDLAIGMIFIFLVFSLAVSGINEAITKVLAWRSRHLWRTLRQLLDGEGKSLKKDQRPKPNEAKAEALRNKPENQRRFAEELYAHPLISQLEGRLPTDRSRLSHLPSKDFARALIDLLVPDKEGNITVDDVKEKVKTLPTESPLRKPLLTLLNEAGNELAALRKDIEEWFDARMESLSRTYRRHTRIILVGLGLAVAVSLNVDAIDAAQRLYRDEALRTAVSGQAVEVVQDCKGASDIEDCTKKEVANIDKSLRLPVGWPDSDEGVDFLQVAGWAISAVALGQGAPFWFDLLRKARRYRAKDQQ